jgi:hypothetical protein
VLLIILFFAYISSYIIQYNKIINNILN